LAEHTFFMNLRAVWHFLEDQQIARRARSYKETSPGPVNSWRRVHDKQKISLGRDKKGCLPGRFDIS
jgi:hypothetical protein